MSQGNAAVWMERSVIRVASVALSGIVALLLAVQGGGIPAPSPDNVPLEQFSSKRALAQMKALLGPGEKPHPPGSKANAEVRNRLLHRLRELGLKPQVQTRWACSPYAMMGCTQVHNVLAWLRAPQAGAPDAKGSAIALSAHYDSVAASPGASDDIAGVGAVLEMARLLLRKAPQRNPISISPPSTRAACVTKERAPQPWSLRSLKQTSPSGPKVSSSTKMWPV